MIATAAEARTGRLAAGAAFLAAGLTGASLAIQTVAIGARRGAVGPRTESAAEALIRLDEHHVELIVSRGLQVLSFFLLAGAWYYLLRAATYRRPQMPRFTTALLLVAPPLIAVGGILHQLDLSQIADAFVSSGDPTDSRARALLQDQNEIYAFMWLIGTGCLGISIVPISFHIRAVGLISGFMQTLSVVGALLLFGRELLPAVVATIGVVWLVALGVLLLDRWPGGRGPAWKLGKAVPPARAHFC